MCKRLQYSISTLISRNEETFQGGGLERSNACCQLRSELTPRLSVTEETEHAWVSNTTPKHYYGVIKKGPRQLSP